MRPEKHLLLKLEAMKLFFLLCFIYYCLTGSTVSKDNNLASLFTGHPKHKCCAIFESYPAPCGEDAAAYRQATEPDPAAAPTSVPLTGQSRGDTRHFPRP